MAKLTLRPVLKESWGGEGGGGNTSVAMQREMIINDRNPRLFVRRDKRIDNSEWRAQLPRQL